MRLAAVAAVAVAGALLALAAPLAAATIEVQLKLPIRPKLALTGKEKIAIAPLVASPSQEDRGGRLAIEIDVEREFHRFLVARVTKDSNLTVVTAENVRLPGGDVRANERNAAFWREVGTQTGADLVIGGSIDFEVEDKSGYKTEEYISPVDGRTYYRQVLVEQTGFLFDILLQVFDAKTGEKVYEEAFQDFREHESHKYDQLSGLFENLHALEARILGIFSPQEAEVTRYIFTD